MAITLREVRSLEDIDYNLRALAYALANISPEQISAGAIGAGAINGEVMPRSGGAFSGDVQAPNLDVTQALTASSAAVDGELSAASAEISGTLVAGSVDAESLTKSGDPVPVQAVALADLGGAISNPPTQAEVTAIRDGHNTLLARLRASGALDT